MALLFWLFLEGICQAYYNPSTGRWLSRDPISELGPQRPAFGPKVVAEREPNSYAFAVNSAVSRHDAFGLTTGALELQCCRRELNFTCADVCRLAAGTKLAEGAGGVICYRGTPCPCLWELPFPFAKRGECPEVDAIQLHHEKKHVKDATCDYTCTPYAWGRKTAAEMKADECKYRKEEVQEFDALLNGPIQLSETCRRNAQAWRNAQQWWVEQNCK